MTTTQTNAYLARRGLKEVILMYQKETPNHWMNIARKDTTTFIAETKQQFSGLGNAQQITEGQRTTWDTVTTPFKKEFVLGVYALGFKATVQTYEYDPYGIIAKYQDWMRRGHYFAKEIAVASMINNLTSASYLGIDGVALGSASHPTATSTFSNYTTGTFGETNLSAMRVLLLQQKDYRDRPWMAVGNHNLIIPVAQDMVARKVLQSTLLPFTNDNTKNVIREFVSFQPGNPNLTGTVWGLIPAMESENPLFHMVGSEMDVRDDYSIDDHSKKVLAVQEFVNGWDRAQGTYFSSGA